MGTTYRCVCNKCKRYIISEEEPDFRDTKEFNRFTKNWKGKCDDFIGKSCNYHNKNCDGFE